MKEEEKSLLFKMLSESWTKTAILLLISRYSDRYVPNIYNPQYTEPLSSLYDPSFFS